jgi:hypothetical protein
MKSFIDLKMFFIAAAMSCSAATNPLIAVVMRFFAVMQSFAAGGIGYFAADRPCFLIDRAFHGPMQHGGPLKLAQIWAMIIRARMICAMIVCASIAHRLMERGQACHASKNACAHWVSPFRPLPSHRPDSCCHSSSYASLDIVR